MNKKKVLVCGVTGFIGRNVAEALAEREDFEVNGVYHIRPIFNNRKINFVKADLTKREDVDRVVQDQDIIIQMAATTSGVKDIVSKPYIFVTNNVLMNSLILRSVFENKIKHFIFPSCTLMYQSSSIPLKESDFDANKELYKNYFGPGWTKIYLEKMCEFFSRLGETKFTVLRHSNIYGSHDKFDLEKSHVFGATMTKVLTAKDGKIIVWGTGEEERDLLYVDDLVDAIVLALNKQESKFELLNIGLGKAAAIKDLVQKIIDASGKSLNIEYDTTKPTIKTSLALDCTKAKTILGWQPKTSLEEGIRKTIEWYKANILRQ
ncbi:MAG: NAD-dependent epimerase/dehydratase family protein [Nanoarchaeota archaeon]